MTTLSDDVYELQQEVLRLRRVVEYMGWNAIDTLQQMPDQWPRELDNVISAFVVEEMKNERGETIQ